MARTPSMTPQEAEAFLGPRGNLRVTAENRAMVRKWLSAMGLASKHTTMMAYSHMQLCYNDTTNKAFNDAKVKAAERESEMPEDNDDSDDSQPTQTTPAPTPTQPVPQNVDAGLQALRALLGGGSISEERVRDIVRTELPNLIPVTRIEIATPTETKSHGPAAHHKQIGDLLQVLSAGCHAVLVGPAGSGKTLAVEQATAMLGREFRITGAVQGAHELLGYKDAYGVYHSTPFRDSFENGHVMCMDEIDGGDASGQLVCNSALANCFMPYPDNVKPVARHPNFIVAACANTYGNGADRLYVGRNQLDAAFLDRFVFINWHYDETLERAIAGNDDWIDRVQALRRGVEKEKARLVISMRASVNGAKLLAAGMSRSKVEDSTIWKGTDAELRRRIEAHA